MPALRSSAFVRNSQNAFESDGEHRFDRATRVYLYGLTPGARTR